jgi:hypothetical protein
MIPDSILGKRLRQKDGHRIMIVKRDEKVSDVYAVYMYKPKIGYSSAPSSPLYRKSWVEWTQQERRQSKRQNKLVWMTERFIRELVSEENLTSP